MSGVQVSGASPNLRKRNRREPKDGLIMFRCSKAERNAIAEAAEMRGLSISAYVRERVLQSVNLPAITVNGVRVQ